MHGFTRGNANIYYEETGSGEPVIALHGLIENTRLWSLPGVAGMLAGHFRLVSMDMRGHGRTVVTGDPKGFDEETMADDLFALADHLGIGRFHVLSHSTGGFIAVRRAMRDPSRFASMVLADTGSMTSIVPGDAKAIRKFHEAFAASFEKADWKQMLAFLKKRPGPFFRGMAESPRVDELFATALGMVELNDRFVIASFVRSFYTDPDPRVEGLRLIGCPVLIIHGEKDDLFIESSRLMAREIPGAGMLEYPGVGHMVPIEEPARFADDIISFYKRHPLA